MGTFFTREDAPIARDIIVFGGKSYKEEGYWYWISAKELEDFWQALKEEAK